MVCISDFMVSGFLCMNYGFGHHGLSVRDMETLAGKRFTGQLCTKSANLYANPSDLSLEGMGDTTRVS